MLAAALYPCMRRLSAAVMVIVLLLATGCVGAFSGGAPNTTPASAQAVGGGSTVGEAGTVTVSASGSVTADPDLAIVRVAVESRADTADAAREAVAADAANVRDALRDLGIPDENVRTAYYHLSAEYDYDRTGTGERVPTGYVATHAFEVRTDVDMAGQVVDTAVTSGADRVSGVQFTLADDTRQELRAQALANAVEHARADADAIAGAAGLSVTGVHAASTTSATVYPYAAVAERADAGGQTTFDAGPVTVTAQVTVAYTVA